MERNGQPGLVNETIELFITHARGQIARLEEAANRGSAGEITACAHSLRGGAANFGAMELENLCRQLEEKMADGNPLQSKEFLPLIADIKTNCDQLEKMAGARAPPRVMI